jgi:hypothetical protein
MWRLDLFPRTEEAIEEIPMGDLGRERQGTGGMTGPASLVHHPGAADHCDSAGTSSLLA